MAIVLTSMVLSAGGDPVAVSARIDASALSTGNDYEIIVEYAARDGASTSDGGIPAPILQIDVPPSAELLGKVLTTHKELSRNEFLEAPFERLLKESPARIGFRLKSEPAADEQFALNFVAYVGERDDAGFVRRRLVLPLAGGAEGTVADPTSSAWGQSDALQIGDRAAAFSLPRADGSNVSLADFAGEKNVVVTTYRAFW